jgi:UPF0755 protein
MKYSRNGSSRKGIKFLVGFLLVVAVFTAGGVYGARRYYFNNLQAVSGSQKTVTVTIPLGSSLTNVADILHQKELIRSTWAFKQFVRNKSLQDSIQAGTYAIKPSQNVESIVAILTEGKVESNLVTIMPGQRIDQVQQTFINAGFAPDAVEAAFNPANYADHPALVDKPAEASLEGYLYPESFQTTAETTPAQIIESSLDEMAARLTPQLRAAFVAQGLSVYRAITLASVVEREVPEGTDRPKVAQVFLKRLSTDMRLESDATASYGAILANEEPSLTYDSDYNTYYRDGLPPGPISNVTESALQAIATPAPTDWLYFVSGDDGKTYFGKTLKEHETLTQQHCKRLCQ